MNTLALFDFDGVIVDSLRLFHPCLADACATEGCDQLRDQAVFLDVFDQNMSEGLKTLGLTPAAIARVLSRLQARFNRDFEAVPLFEGMPDVLNTLAAQGPVYVITSNLGSIVAGALRRHGVQGVRAVLGSDQNPSKVVKFARPSRPTRSAGTPIILAIRAAISWRAARLAPVPSPWGGDGTIPSGWPPPARILWRKPRPI